MTLPLEPFVGTAFRAHHPRWAFNPESGEGASRHGGRFNPPGTPALYLSLRPETAWLEAQQGFAFKAQPMTLCAYEVDCLHILDLTSIPVRHAVSADYTELACPWENLASRNIEPPSWRLAKRLIDSGVAGIVVPSFAGRATAQDQNLVLWSWDRSKPNLVRVIDDHNRLPRNDESWANRTD